MKKILSLILTLTLVVTFFALGSTSVAAEEPAACTTDKTVYVHYHRWDGEYADTTIWAWGYGTNGSGAGNGVHGTDGFGAIYQICVDSADAGSEIGLINKYSAAWGDGWTDRDAVDTDENGSKDGNHKNIMIKDENGDFVGFDENGMKHVYVFEGSNQVIYTDDANSLPYSADVATIAVVYYDPAESYDGWNIWTWSTGTLGSQVDAPYGGSGIPLQSSLGVDGGTVENFRVAFIQVDPADMGENIGFIMRTDAWEKKFDGDINISTDGLVAGDFKTVFYIAGEGMVRDTFEDFDATVNFFEIESATALDPNSISVVFNKEVVTKVEDELVLEKSAFMLKNVHGETIAISQLSYNSVTEVNDTFTLITEEALNGADAPYKLYYMVGGAEFYTKLIEVDNEAPVITLLGPATAELELGDTYSLPNFFASDVVDGESVGIYNVRVKDGMGTVDTRNAGIYEVVIEASDKFGNVAETTITVTVKDPCDDTAHLSASNINEGFIALLIGLPLALGAAVSLKRSI